MRVESIFASTKPRSSSKKYEGVELQIKKNLPIKKWKDAFLHSDIFDADGNRIEKDQERPSHIYNDKGELILGKIEIDPRARRYTIYDDEGNRTWVDQRTFFREKNKNQIMSGESMLFFPTIDEIDPTTIRELLADLKEDAKYLIKNGKTPTIMSIQRCHTVLSKEFLACIDEYGDDELKAMFDDGLIKMQGKEIADYSDVWDVLGAVRYAQKDTFRTILKSIEAELGEKIGIDSEKFDKMWKELYDRAYFDANKFSRKEMECLEKNENGYISREYFDERVNKNLSKNFIDYVAKLYEGSGTSSEEFYEKMQTAIGKGFNEEKTNVLRVANLYKGRGLDAEEFSRKMQTAIRWNFDAGYLRNEEKNLPDPPVKRFRPNNTKDIIQYVREIYKEKPPKPIDTTIFNREMVKWFSRMQELVDEDLFISFANRWTPRDSWSKTNV